MKRFLLYVVALVGVAGFVLALNDLLVYSMVMSSSCSSAYKMKRLFGNQISDELPLLGSSRAKENYVPSIISPSCFDYGENGQAFAETLFHLKHVLSRTGLKRVIVNLEPWGPGDVGSGYRCDYRFANPCVGMPYVRWLDRLPGIRFVGSLRSGLAMWMNERKSVTRVVDNGAMLLNYECSDAEFARMEAALTDRAFECSPRMKAAIGEVLDKNMEVEIIWVVSPVSNVWNDHFTGSADLAAFGAWIETFPKNQFLDFHRANYLNFRDFKDPCHLNFSGARKFSAELVKVLESGDERHLNGS